MSLPVLAPWWLRRFLCAINPAFIFSEYRSDSEAQGETWMISLELKYVQIWELVLESFPLCDFQRYRYDCVLLVVVMRQNLYTQRFVL